MIITVFHCLYIHAVMLVSVIAASIYARQTANYSQLAPLFAVLVPIFIRNNRFLVDFGGGWGKKDGVRECETRVEY